MEHRAASRLESAGARNIWVLPGDLQQLIGEGAEDLVAEVMTTFRADTAARLAVLHEVIASGNSSLLRAEAHALKGSAAQVGAEGMARLCREMEERAASGAIVELNSLLNQLDSQFEEICRMLDTLRWGGVA